MKNVAAISSYSHSSVYLQMIYKTEPLAVGTGLLARAVDGNVFLVTALHNFTGREPNGKPKSKTGGIPNCVKVTGYNFEQVYMLYDQEYDPNTNNPTYWHHPSGPTIDVCALPIPHGGGTALAPLALDPSFLNPDEYARNVQLHISQMCFVVGYPEGLFIRQSGNVVLPIWKTGHIASEPSVGVDSHPKLLIDASTCEGMSGSPVYVCGDTGNRLLGIYTGRTSQISELGFVFTPETIMKILQTGPIHGGIRY